MKTVITAKIKLHTTQAHFQALRATQLAYRDGLNSMSQYAFAHNKMSNKVSLQDGTYNELRTRFHLPSQMACSIPRQVGASYKTLWTRMKQNAQQRRAGQTRKRYKGLDHAPKYISPTLTYQYGKDYSFKKEQQVSILTPNGRVVVAYTGYEKHVALIEQGAEIGAAKLWYDQPKKRFYLLVTLETEVADPTPATHTNVMGVDVAIRQLAVTSTTRGKATFYSGTHLVAKTNHYARLRKRLQQKGTRSVTRRLVAISGRERRLNLNTNHLISRRIVTANPHSVIGLEQLTNIGERTRRRKGKAASAKQRNANAVRSKWAFAELHTLIAYKALQNQSIAITVDAHYTSQACPICGHTCPENRPSKGLLFVCQNCHYTLHADLVGARNIPMRTLLVRQDWMSAGQLSFAPDVSDREAKALRLARYRELRWNPDTSPLPSGGSI